MQLPSNSAKSRSKQTRRAKAALTAASFVVFPATSAFLAGFGTAHAVGNGLLTGLVFNDVDRDGSQAASGEPGVDGITATAYTSLGGIDTAVGTAVTANGGSYSINLNATVALGDPIKVIFTGLGTNQAVNPAQTTQTVYMRTGTSGGTFETTANLGVVTSSSISVSIGDRIWIDTDGNGVQNISEVAFVNQLGGIAVDLLDVSGAVVASTVTNQDGYYRFVDPATYIVLGGATAGSGIASYAFPTSGGTYRVRVTGLTTAGSKLAGYTNTVLSGSGSTAENDSDGTTCVTGSGAPAGTNCDPISAPVNVPADTSYSNQTIDFGVLPYNYSVVQTAVSSSVVAGGPASFNVTVTNLGPGSATPCTIINLLPAGLTYAPTNPITGLSANASLSGIDPSDASKFVLNCNTRIGLNEAVTFTVNTIVGATATGTLKNFTYVADSTTDVAGAERIALAYAPTNASNATTSGTDNDSEAVVNVTAVAATASLGDKVWFDDNKNGVQESDELPVEGVSVQLLDASGNVIAGKTSATDANGVYAFTGLVAGTYSVKFGTLANYIFTTQNAGAGTEATDSDVNTTSGISDPVTLSLGENNPNVDAGLIAIPSATTTATTTTTTTTTTAAPATTTTTTGTVAPPVPFTPTTSTVASSTTTSTTTTPATSSTTSTTTAKPVSAVVANPTCKINSVVWIDTNVNGLVDAGEQVMPGVTVRVTAGGIVKEAVTDGLGRYSFLDINCGDVTVEIISGLPAGTPLPAPKTIKVLGESAEAPLLVPFGVQLPTAAEVAYGGAESRQFLAAALTFLGMGGLLVSRKRKESGLRR